MTDRRNANHSITLRSRPSGIAGPEHFAEISQPIRPLDMGEVCVQSLYVSIDPAMRVWINEAPGYVQRVEIGEVMRASGIGRVVESRVPGLEAGDLVSARLGWQTMPTLPASAVEKLDLSLGDVEDFLCLLGITGITAYFGLREVARLRPGETVLVSGAAGGVGQMVGQIAKIEGCRVIGIAGGAGKCAGQIGRAHV